MMLLSLRVMPSTRRCLKHYTIVYFHVATGSEQTKPNQTNQTNQTNQINQKTYLQNQTQQPNKHTTSDLANQPCQTKPTELNQLNQSYLCKHTEPNLQFRHLLKQPLGPLCP